MQATSRSVRVLGIAGSLRLRSFNAALLDAAHDCAPRRVELERYRAMASLPMFNEDLEPDAFGRGPVAAFVATVRRADALLVSTPEYNHSLPGALKNALDWLSRPGALGVLEGRPVAVVGATTGRWGTRLAQAALRQVLTACEVRFVPAPPLYLAAAADAFDADGRLLDAGARAALGGVLQSLADACASATGRHGVEAEAAVA